MGKIHVLDTEISDKIAAGEVVERPASVIKELVENSIDAGADKITVEIKKGGVMYMRVTDNGSGMSADDARICFLRHATSKIQSSGDLAAIQTLGFRGEALSSIGAVANVTLYTKQHGEIGTRVTCNGGEINTAEDAGVPDGTSVIAENLFYNTPARLKFLKKDATETGYITDIISRFILAHPEISFKLISDGKEKLFSSGDSSLKNAVYTVYGKDYAKAVLEVDFEYENIKVTGVAGKGTASRPNRNYQSFFVNKRYIKSPLIMHAVEEAYKNQIMIGKFPMVVLNLEINPELIDINVHPTKLEVKFSNEKDVYHAAYYAVKNALYAIPDVPKIERSEAEEERGAVNRLTLSDMAEEMKKSPQLRAEMKAPRDALAYGSVSEHRKVTDAGKMPPGYGFRENAYVNHEPETVSETDEAEKIDALKERYGDILDNPQKYAHVADSNPLIGRGKDIPAPSTAYGSETAPSAAQTSENEAEEVFIDEYFEVVGQIFDTYIIVEKDDEMLLIDQHAAHERLKYEELKRTMRQNQIYSQILLEPEVVNLTGAEFGAYRENKDIFASLGFEIEEFGEDTLLVRSVPGDVEIGEVEPLVIELISQAETSKKELITEKNQRLLYTIACKSAIKANTAISKPEMETLVRNVFRLKNINTCPHGRPIIISMSKKEIEKEFKRIV